MSRIAAITPHVRRMAAKGWSAPSIARAYGVTVRTILDILSPPPRPFRLAFKRTPRPVDPWRGNNWRFRNDVGVELPAAAIAPELVDQGEAAAIPAEPDPPGARPASSIWSGPASPCVTSLHGGRRRIKD